MSQKDIHEQSQRSDQLDFPAVDLQKVPPDRLVRSELHEGRQDSRNNAFSTSIEEHGVVNVILARYEDERIAIVDGWDRVQKARELGLEEVPIWLPEQGSWSDEKVLLVRLITNTGLFQKEMDWLRRGWLLEDLWNEIGDTRQISPTGLADVLDLPESTARHWAEPAREKWTNTILDRDFYENGQIRETHENIKYIKTGLKIEKVVGALGTRTLIEIRTKTNTKDALNKILREFVNDEIESDEFKRAKTIADEDGCCLLEALNRVQEDRGTEISMDLVGKTAKKIEHVADEFEMNEDEILENAIDQHLNTAHLSDADGYVEADSGHHRQISYLDEHVAGARPTPELRMESNEQMSELPANSVHLTVTSPPYNVGWEYGETQSDNRAYYEEYLAELIARTFREVYRVTVDGGYCCIVVPQLYDVDDEDTKIPKGTSIAADIEKLLTGEWIPAEHDAVARLHDETDWQLFDLVTWYKGMHDAGLRKQDYVGENLLKPELKLNNFVEAILVLRKPGEREVPESIVQQSGITWQNDVEDRDLRENLWRIKPESWEPKTVDSDVADTAQFPEELAKRCITHWSYVGDTVLDPFCGRGTTLKMAKQLYRDSIGFEVQEELERDIREYVGLPQNTESR